MIPARTSPNDPLSKVLRGELEKLREAGLHRSLHTLSSPPSARIMVGGRTLLNFASNNYLGLAEDPRVQESAREALKTWGTGATASRLLGGTLEVHARLERELADFKGTEAAVVFPSGYHANMGTLPALMGPDDAAFLDRYAHASLVDGVRLSRARLRVFRHNDPADLEKALKRERISGRRWVVTESVFSMDGDAAPLQEIADMAARHGAQVYVDEAHATGLWGPDGRGLLAALGMAKQIDVTMGTLSKALGGLGGFVAGSRELVEWVQNRSRSFIYSTALPPASAAGALAALEICRGEPARRERLFALSRRLREGLARLSEESPAAGRTLPGEGPIVPFVLGSEAAALALARFLWDRGIYAPAIRPPTVPKGTARLRFSLTANHTEDDIDRVLESVESYGRGGSA